jgi:hypothetical protein
VHTWRLRVEHFSDELMVDGYIGVTSARNPEHTAVGFALRCDDGTLGAGQFGCMDPIEGSHRLGDGQEFVLEVDVDAATLTLRAEPGAPELARCDVGIDKPWVPALMVSAKSAAVRLVGKLSDGGAKKSNKRGVAEKVAWDWRVRSLASGEEYGVSQVLELLLRLQQLECVPLEDLEHLFLLFKKGADRLRASIVSRLAATTVEIQPPHDAEHERAAGSVAVEEMSEEQGQELVERLQRAREADLAALPTEQAEELLLLFKSNHLKLHSCVAGRLAALGEGS